MQLGQGRWEYFTWEGSYTDPTVVATSFYSGLFAYMGWNFLNFIIEEMKDPVRDLPRHAVALCYTLTDKKVFFFFSPPKEPSPSPAPWWCWSTSCPSWPSTAP